MQFHLLLVDAAILAMIEAGLQVNPETARRDIFDIYNNKFLKALRSVRVPIPGYYIWEIVCYRPST